MVNIFRCLIRHSAEKDVRMAYFRDSFPEAAAACDAEFSKSAVRREMERFARRTIIRPVQRAAEYLRAGH